MTEVKVVRRKNGLVLVQWQGEEGVPKRAWVTPDMVQQDDGDTAAVEDPDAGVPYGVEFWRWFEIAEVTPQDVDRELKRRGIWTVADLRADPNAVRTALQTVFGMNLAALLQAAAKYEQDLKEAEKHGIASL